MLLLFIKVELYIFKFPIMPLFFENILSSLSSNNSTALSFILTVVFFWFVQILKPILDKGYEL